MIYFTVIPLQSVEGVVEPESGDDIPIRMLDCDSITQAKEKVLDALYKNNPASKRPQLTEVDLSKYMRHHYPIIILCYCPSTTKYQ